jgi:hypothetical protein
MTRWKLGRILGIVGVPLLIAGCASAPLEQAGSLSSYRGLDQADGLLAKSKLHINKDAVLAAKTVRIVPTVFANRARIDTISDDQRKLASGQCDRSVAVHRRQRAAGGGAGLAAGRPDPTRGGHPYGPDRRDGRGGEPGGQGGKNRAAASHSGTCAPWRRRRAAAAANRRRPWYGAGARTS